MIKQALIAAGGRAARMQTYTGPKCLIEINGKPILYMLLSRLETIGINQIIIATDSDEVEKRVSSYRPIGKATNIRILRDKGLGVHGLPVHAAEMLDDLFIFEAGHSIMSCLHYARLAAMQNFAWTASKDTSNSSRYKVDNYSLALPFAAKRDEYNTMIQRCNFSIGKLLDEIISRDQIIYLPTETPLEFDTDEEFQNVITWSNMSHVH